MSAQLPADTTGYKSLILLKKKHSHDVRFKNILYRSLAVLLSGFCMIVMNLSLSDTAPEPYMTEVQEMEKGGSSLFQSWAFYAEMLLIFYLSCVA